MVDTTELVCTGSPIRLPNRTPDLWFSVNMILQMTSGAEVGNWNSVKWYMLQQKGYISGTQIKENSQLDEDNDEGKG